jgi:hypothetical protein
MKYDSNFDIIWVKVINGTLNDTAVKVVVDNEDNVYMTGTYNSSSIVNLGNNVSLPVSNAGDGYFVKFDPNGNALWSKTYIGTDNPGTITHLAVDSGNNVYVTGGYGSGSSIGSLAPGVPLPTTAGYAAYVVKYTSVGDYVWHRIIDGNGTESGRGIIVDSLNNIGLLGNIFNVTPIDLNRDGSLILPTPGLGVVSFAVIKFGPYTAPDVTSTFVSSTVVEPPPAPASITSPLMYSIHFVSVISISNSTSKSS